MYGVSCFSLRLSAPVLVNRIGYCAIGVVGMHGDEGDDASGGASGDGDDDEFDSVRGHEGMRMFLGPFYLAFGRFSPSRRRD